MTLAELKEALDRANPFDSAEVVVDMDGTLVMVSEVRVAVNLVRIIVAMEDA
jgi:hypothetical protein